MIADLWSGILQVLVFVSGVSRHRPVDIISTRYGGGDEHPAGSEHTGA